MVIWYHPWDWYLAVDLPWDLLGFLKQQLALLRATKISRRFSRNLSKEPFQWLCSKDTIPWTVFQGQCTNDLVKGTSPRHCSRHISKEPWILLQRLCSRDCDPWTLFQGLCSKDCVPRIMPLGLCSKDCVSYLSILYLLSINCLYITYIFSIKPNL